eukprot:4562509-Pleurochrysis_carterae.AAC.1
MKRARSPVERTPRPRRWGTHRAASWRPPVAGRPDTTARRVGTSRLTAWGHAKRKHLTMSGSYSAEDTNGSPVGTKTSQICRRLSLASQRINTSAKTSSIAPRIRCPRRRSSSALRRTAAMRRRPAR